MVVNMKDYIVKVLKEKASIPGKQETWVSSMLSDKQRYTIFLKLRRDETSRSIAGHIQKAWGILPDSTIHSISQGVTKFKKRIAHLLLDHQPESIDPESLDDFPLGKFEGAESLERIAKYHQDRIIRMMEDEKSTGVLYPHLNRDIQALSQLYRALTKQKEWELVHENADPVKRRRLERKKQKLDDAFGHLMREVGDPTKLIKAIDMAIELAEERAIPYDEYIANKKKAKVLCDSKNCSGIIGADGRCDECQKVYQA